MISGFDHKALSFLKSISPQKLFAYSPDLHELLTSCPVLARGEGIADNLYGNRSLCPSSYLARADFFAIAAIEHCSFGFWPSAWSWRSGWNELEMYKHLNDYGSLVGYSVSSAGNAEELDMLKVIAGLPALIPGTPIGAVVKPDSTWRSTTARSRSTLLSALACLAAGDPALFLRGLEAAPHKQLYAKLLGADVNGVASFERANDVDQGELIECIHTIFYEALNRRSNARPLTPTEWFGETGSAMTALSVTQSHVFLEQGADPLAVFELAHRRLMAFLSFLGIDPHREHIARVGASAAFLVHKWRSVAPFVRDEDLAGVDYETVTAIDGRNTLNILKMAPGILAGAMSFFNQSENVEQQNSVFDTFRTKQHFERVAGAQAAHAFELKMLHRTASYLITKNPGHDAIFEYKESDVALREYQALKTCHSPWLHPAITYRIGWQRWPGADTFERLFAHMLSDKMEGDGLAEKGLKIFAHSYPERFESCYLAMKMGGVSRKIYERAERFITPAMPSFQNLNELHWSRALEGDLGM
jgi:hypothetical protein